MVFSSITFIYYFLPVVLLLYFICPKRMRNTVLLICSLFFYVYGDISYLWLLLFSCCFNFTIGILIDKYRKHSKLYLIIGISINLLLLIYFKYTNFFVGILNSFGTKIDLYNIVLPLGISFYTFQNLSYIIDVYMKNVKVNKNIFDYSTYVVLFPQLIAGPIVRYRDVEEELKTRECSFSMFSFGIQKFIIGLSKKVLIANSIGEMINVLYDIPSMSVFTYILIAIGYSLQIYYDFSGYSDMAIGLGRMFGFNFLENFNYPFIASSITDFWRRWHMSLSRFFKDYVYIPLGGSRKGSKRLVLNLFVVWLLTGIWHGANYNFILWGLFFFTVLVLEKFFLKEFLSKHKIFGHIYSILIIILSFVIFSITDLSELFVFIKSMFGFNNLAFVNSETLYYFRSYFILIFISILLSTPILSTFKKFNNKFISVLGYIFLFALFILVTSSLVDSSFNPFLYFRF